MLGFGLTSAAVAEGSRENFFRALTNNSETARWQDDNKTASVTAMILAHCTNASSGGTTVDPRFELRRHRALQPDVTHGSKQMGNCYKSTTEKSWGRMTTKGQYFYRYRGMNNTTHSLSAQAAKLRW